MHNTFRTLLVAATVVASAGVQQALACTNILVTKGASKDGKSTMVSFNMDSHELYGALSYRPAGIHVPGTMRDIFDGESGKFLGRVKEAPVTYTRLGFMNEYQLTIGETTTTGRKELEGPSGIIDYDSLIYMALERTKTARDAIKVMSELVDEYGYSSTCESFSIADPNEVWIFEIIGKGKGNKGALWVAVKIPDGMISAHANLGRVRQFMHLKNSTDLSRKDVDCYYAKDVVSFARDKGWYKGEDKDFSFADTYCPANFGSKRWCEGRVWSVFNHVAPSLKLSSDYVKDVKDAKPYPLWIPPDKKLSVRDVMGLMRDHFEDTEFDMRNDVGAGPYKLPYRWRPMEWEVDGQKYLHERAISTQQTGATWVSQARADLPDPIGGVFWFGMDDSYTTVYVPFYCGILEVPKAWGEQGGSFDEFSWDSAFWVFNFTANWAYTRWSDMIVDLQTVQDELEGKFEAEQPEIDKAAKKLYEQSPMLAREYLTKYSSQQANMVMARWKKLGEFLIWKYLDGNVHMEKGLGDNARRKHPPYHADWYRRIVKEKGDFIKIPKSETTD